MFILPWERTQRVYNNICAVFGDYTIIIKNVPCLECVQCGEKYYTDEVMQNIEKIVTKEKELNDEFFVAEYKTA